MWAFTLRWATGTPRSVGCGRLFLASRPRRLRPSSATRRIRNLHRAGCGRRAGGVCTGAGENALETRRKGHGRNGADAYTGAEKIEVPHESLQPGDPCPKCEEGTVYKTDRPGVLVRLMGQAPVGALVYYLQKLRCSLCGTVFTAEPPEGADGEKYDATVGSMIALLKYGNGMPFNRGRSCKRTLAFPCRLRRSGTSLRPRRSVRSRSSRS